MLRRLPVLLLLPALLCLTPPALAQEKPLSFVLSFDRNVSDKPFTGRVYVMLFREESTALRSGPSWFSPEPFFALDVKDWRPGEKLVLDQRALAFPVPLSKVPKGLWSIQAVMDCAPNSQSFSTAPGNGYCRTLRRPLDPTSSGPVELVLDQVYVPRPFNETERVKLVDIESRLLTKFNGFPTRMKAGVLLPASWGRDPRRRYPVVYEIPGFSGTHEMVHGRAKLNASDVAGTEMIWVVLDPSCRNGHHVFADSANNGPCGQALVEELIPHIERTFRGIGQPGARFVTGHSSGGWSSLWLQVRYPDFFGGCWSTAPDPVDFRDFQRVDIYRAGVNLFTDAEGQQRPLARRGGKPVLWYRGFSDMEEVMGHGGQLGSFEAVFSERGPDGRPRRLWDRRSGAVDPVVARSWERYDIRLVLERNWKDLGPRLAGKLHVYTGGDDTFYLDGATRLLRESLARLGSDAVVEIFPGKDHGTLMSMAMRQRIAREMAAQAKAALTPRPPFATPGAGGVRTRRAYSPSPPLGEGVGPASRAGQPGAARLAAPTEDAALGVGPASRAGQPGAARLAAPTSSPPVGEGVGGEPGA